jgi:hypothetical protein
MDKSENSISVCLSIYGFPVLLLDLDGFFSFLILYTVDRTTWTGDQPAARPLLTHRMNTHRHPCLEWDSNPRSQHSSQRRQTVRPLWSATPQNSKYKFLSAMNQDHWRKWNGAKACAYSVHSKQKYACSLHLYRLQGMEMRTSISHYIAEYVTGRCVWLAGKNAVNSLLSFLYVQRAVTPDPLTLLQQKGTQRRRR